MTLSGKVRQMAEIHREAELSREAVVPFPGTSHNQWIPWSIVRATYFLRFVLAAGFETSLICPLTLASTLLKASSLVSSFLADSL